MKLMTGMTEATGCLDLRGSFATRDASSFGAISDVNGTVGFPPNALERVDRIWPRVTTAPLF